MKPTRADMAAQLIRRFVENPVTNLLKGLALLAIGLADVGRTFREDIAHRHVSLGHGLVMIGFFSVLSALPHLIDSLEAGGRLLETREQSHPTGKADNP
jgi:hypothetical protein